MKRFILTLTLLVSLLAAGAQNLVIGTYNIRLFLDSDEQKGEVWRTRCKVMCDQMNFVQPDAFGAQEVLYGQLKDMLRQLDGYDAIGRARDDGQDTGEFSPIFYKKDRLRLLDNGTFWLSETPDQVSFGWDAACRRVCSWAKFKTRKGGFTFYMFNMHMDHIGTTARREGAKLVMQRIATIAKGAPVVLTGDFNVDQNDEVYGIFAADGSLRDTYTHARLRFAENGTFIDFDPDAFTPSRIDHIFVSRQFAVDAYAVLTNCYWTPTVETAYAPVSENGPSQISVATYSRHTPSDHYPIITKLLYK